MDVVHESGDVLFYGQSIQFFGLGAVHDHRFLDQDVLPAVDGFLGKFVMRLGWRGDDNGVGVEPGDVGSPVKFYSESLERLDIPLALMPYPKESYLHKFPPD